MLKGQSLLWPRHFLLLLKHACCLGAWVTGSIFLQGEVRLAQLTEETLVQVELDIFSGRVNPVWPLSSDESQEFLHLFQSLPRVTAGTIREGLGYRGMIVTVPGSTVAGFDTVRCSAGICVGASVQMANSDSLTGIVFWSVGCCAQARDAYTRPCVPLWVRNLILKTSQVWHLES